MSGLQDFSAWEHNGSEQGCADWGGRAWASGQKCESRPMSGSYDFGQLGSGGDVPVPELTYGSNEKFIEATLWGFP